MLDGPGGYVATLRAALGGEPATQRSSVQGGRTAAARSSPRFCVRTSDAIALQFFRIIDSIAKHFFLANAALFQLLITFDAALLFVPGLSEAIREDGKIRRIFLVDHEEKEKFR